MSKKIKKPQKIKVSKVLFKFYKVDIFTHDGDYKNYQEAEMPLDKGGFEIFEDKDVTKKLKTKHWDIDGGRLTSLGSKYFDSCYKIIDVNVFSDPTVKAVIDENKDKYDKIQIVLWGDWRTEEEYRNNLPLILGIREETDEELNARWEAMKKEHEKKEEEKLKRKKEIEAKKEAEEKAEFERLQKKYAKK